MFVEFKFWKLPKISKICSSRISTNKKILFFQISNYLKFGLKFLKHQKFVNFQKFQREVT
jgi:hypothetical protein